MTLSIRPCKADDYSLASALMHQAEPEGYRYVFSITSEDQALAFLRYSFKQAHGSFSFKTHHLILKDEHPLGIFGLRTAHDNLRFMFNAAQDILHFYSLREASGVIYRGLKLEQVIQPPKRGRLYLYDFSIDESAQNKGLGSFALNAIFEQAIAQGLNTVALDVAEGNDRAKRLYERMGFKACCFKKGGAQSKYGKVLGQTYMEAQI